MFGNNKEAPYICYINNNEKIFKTTKNYQSWKMCKQ